MTKTDVQLPCKYYNSLGFAGNFGIDMNRLWKNHILLLAAWVARATLKVAFVGTIYILIPDLRVNLLTKMTFPT